MKRTQGLMAALLVWFLLVFTGTLTGCGFISGMFGGDEVTEEASGQDPEGDGEDEPDPSDSFGSGVLNRIAEMADPGSSSQFLARLAGQFDWEEQVSQNTGLRKSVDAGDFDDRVEPYLLGLFYKNGFSVLPMVGEGHQFNSDTVVRGAVGATRLLVTTRDTVRIIFLSPVQNVQIVYHQDGNPPRVFSVNEAATIAVRQSLLKWYLR